MEFLEDFLTPFDPDRFKLSRTFERIGDLQQRSKFAQPARTIHQVRQLPIKSKGASELVLPEELSQYSEFLELVAQHNRTFNPHYQNSYAYFNVFNGKTNPESYRGLSLTLHPDQMQTLLPGHAYPPDWTYICSTCLPTMFFEREFDLSEAVRSAGTSKPKEIYELLREQIANDPHPTSRSINYGVHLLSPYCIHAASPSRESIPRVFVKLAFSQKRFFDNREMRRGCIDTRSWFTEPTVGYTDGFFSHRHWNERYLKSDVSS